MGKQKNLNKVEICAKNVKQKLHCLGVQDMLAGKKSFELNLKLFFLMRVQLSSVRIECPLLPRWSFHMS